MRKKNPRSFRAGKRKRVFAEPFKLLDMAWIFTTGVTEHIWSGFAVNITEIFFIQKCTAAIILTESLFRPVDIIVQSIAKSPFEFFVLFQTFFVNYNLPAGTACVGTGSCNTGKFFVKIRACDLHRIVLSLKFKNASAFCKNNHTFLSSYL